jgi:hypothetical protein
VPRAAPLSEGDRALLERLNRSSREQRIDFDAALDWSASTTDQEYLALYDAWSLLAGSGRDAALDARARIDFARYQQANLMLFTAFLELYGLRVLERLGRDESDPLLAEALAQFAREETAHQRMFTRAVARLEAEMPARRRLPRRHIELFYRIAFGLLARLPSRRLRASAGFLVLEFAEEVSIVAHSVSSRTVLRKESFAPRIWALHAIDEARHLRFDGFVRARCRLPAGALLAVKLAAAGLAVLSSALLNANDVWAARQVGAPVSLWHLPMLLRSTTAPFKRGVFATLGRLWARSA